MDTIFAPATAPGRAGVAIVRVSGPGAEAAAMALAGTLPGPRVAALRRLCWQGEVLDEALVLRFAAGASFTGEEVVEFHLHGGPAVMAAVLRALAAQPGLRMAEAGEFTRRAFVNGRMDLAQVEGLADLIEAETELQRRQARRAIEGRLSAKVREWRAALLRASGLIEAAIDFSEEDLPADILAETGVVVDALVGELQRELAQAPAAERLRSGFEVAILGAPNVGKSTLFNMIAGREAAITSACAGTTRDVIEVRMDLEGVAVTLLDTAGLRVAEDPVEKIGIARTHERAAAADLRVFLRGPEGLPAGVAPDPCDIVVGAKADLTGDGVSGLTGAGVDALLAEIRARLASRLPSDAIILRERQRTAAARAVDSLGRVRLGLEQRDGAVELVAEHLRDARMALEHLVGAVGVEDVLGEVFSRFCIGK